MPDVFCALAQAYNFTKEEAQQKMDQLRQMVNETVSNKIDEIALRYTKRYIDYLLKTMGLNSKTISNLCSEYQSTSSGIDPEKVFNVRKQLIMETMAAKDYEKLLLHVDDKELLALAAKVMGLDKKPFVDFAYRTLALSQSQNLRAALVDHLPVIVANPSSP